MGCSVSHRREEKVRRSRHAWWFLSEAKESVRRNYSDNKDEGEGENRETETGMGKEIEMRNHSAIKEPK